MTFCSLLITIVAVDAVSTLTTGVIKTATSATGINDKILYCYCPERRLEARKVPRKGFLVFGVSHIQWKFAR